MLDAIPSKEEMTALVGKPLYDVWQRLCALIDETYDMDRLWDKGGRAWDYEYKYRRGGKTLCALYARENCVEADRESYAKEVQERYDGAQTYHDGKWIMFEPVDASLFQDFMRLLRIKRKPNKK